MLIGISGKIGSGKDTVGSVIQYLSSDFSNHYPLTEWIGRSNNQSSWEIKKFAGKLKQITAILTGCKISDLESQIFKDSKLSHEWNYVIGPGQEPLPVSHYEKDEEFIQNKDRYTQHYTYRKMLQLLGTNALRNVIHENVWVNALFADYKIQGYDTTDCPRTVGRTLVVDNGPIYPNWIVTDMRFPNELKAIKDRNGITIRVNRDLKIKERQIGASEFVANQVLNSLHPSETALDNAKFDYVIDNNGTIEELVEKVREILIKEKVI